MKNIWHLFNIHFSTYLLILSFLLTGLIKNIILIYLIVLFHELGHILIIKLLGYKILRVDIYPSGGVTKIDKKINTKLSFNPTLTANIKVIVKQIVDMHRFII